MYLAICDQIGKFSSTLYLAFGPARGKVGVAAASDLELVAAGARHRGVLPGAHVGDFLAHRGWRDLC